jgi:regulator of RNase E activity RraA
MTMADQARDTPLRLSRLDCCAVSDALDKLGLRGVAPGIGRQSGSRRISGPVVTVKLGVGESGSSSSRHLCTSAIDDATAGSVIVVEHHSGIDAGGWGGILSLGARLRGVAGVIVDGPVRDVDDSRAIDFPVFARSVTPRTARGRIVEVSFNQPIAVGDLRVAPGDFVVADGSGVVFVAAADVIRVVETAEAIVAREAEMARALLNGARISDVMGASYEKMVKR